MKKLMIIATVAIAAFASNASALKWGTNSAANPLDYTTEGQEGLKGGTAYLVLLSTTPGAYANATAAAAAIPDIAAFKLQDGKYTVDSIKAAGGILFPDPSGDEGAVMQGTLVNGKYANTTAITVTDINGKTGKYYAYMVAIGSDGQSLALSTVANEYNIVAAASPVNKYFNGGTQFEYAVAPEPTSGLLLLLGVAGLALKRKRA